MSDGWLDRALKHIRLFSDCVPARGEVASTSSPTLVAAEEVAKRLHGARLEPDRITHGADGEVTFWFITKRVEVRIVVDEVDGELLMCARRKSDGSRRYAEAFSSSEAAQLAKKWLTGGWVKLFETIEQ